MSILWLCGLIVMVLFVSGVTNQQATDDATILLQFKSSLQQDPSGRLGTWGASGNITDVCAWTGITCTSARVTFINLDGANLQGGVSAISLLARLPMLKSISLSRNNFTQGLFSNLTLNSSGSCGLEFLDLSYNYLQGDFRADTFGPCMEIQSINLTQNLLTGGMAAELFQIEGMKVLDLSYNRLMGPLPARFVAANCTSLEVLNLSHNNFTGGVPSGFGLCPKLSQIDLSNNTLSSGIPADLFIGNCSNSGQIKCPPTQLQKLNISFNSLTGPLPITNSCTTSLQSLDLSRNNLSSSLPSALGNCSSLIYLNLSRNSFSGELQLAFSNGCALQQIDLSANANLSGSFPSVLFECASLQAIILAFNNFTGEISNTVGTLKDLELLALGVNNFSGPFPVGVANCSSLQVLDICSNNLSGEIPRGICLSSSQLQLLMLQDNDLSGPIPPDLSECQELLRLDFSFNHLTGVVPDTLGSLSKLEGLYLWNNELNGSIPAELSQLSQLKNLILNNNRLQGFIPPELSNCTMLEWISLGNNKLNGTIPSALFNLKRLGIVQLANNLLTGTIPVESINATNLMWLDLSRNKLTGNIPGQLGRLTGGVSGTLLGNTVAFVKSVDPHCGLVLCGLLELAGIRKSDVLNVQGCEVWLYGTESFPQWYAVPTVFYIDLSNNNLQGSIPPEFGQMSALTALILDNNNLTGSIPSNISQCSELMTLELSSNSLNGTIPVQLTNLTLLNSLNLSHNHLQGPIPQGGQFLTFPPWVYGHNSGLCGRPLNWTCLSPAPTPIPAAPDVDKGEGGMKTRNKMLITFLSIGGALGIIFLLLRRKAEHYCCWLKVGDINTTINTTKSTCSDETSWNQEDLGTSVTVVEAGLPKTLTFGDLVAATNNFDNSCIVGIGGFGQVYRAVLEDKTIVAVKRLICYTYQGEREFIAEMEILSRIKHKNLVRLLGFCKVKEERLLIYEYMCNGSLECVLHGEELHPLDVYQGPRYLPWHDRKQIALDAARGLAFLHHGCEPHIIHRDFKSSNVLLDNSLQARVSDFGLAKNISEWETHLSVSTFSGTPGYVPPEYYQSFRCTRQGDVYSYGVVLLELISGRRPTEEEEFEDSNLVGWVKKKIREDLIEEIFDPFLQQQGDDNELLQYVGIAHACVDDSPSHRPTMLFVIAKLKEIILDIQDL